MPTPPSTTQPARRPTSQPARRLRRFITSLLAAVLLLGALAESPASAADERAERQLNDRAKHKQNGTWVIKGRATPEGGDKPIIVKRKKCADCGWKKIGTVRTKKKTGRFQIELTFPKSDKPTWYTKGILKGGKKYKTARTRTYLTCSRPDC